MFFSFQKSQKFLGILKIYQYYFKIIKLYFNNHSYINFVTKYKIEKSGGKNKTIRFIYSKNIIINMIGKILKSVKDFEEKILDGTIKVCFLHENSKVSKHGWAGFVKPEDLYEPSNANNNLGISLIGSEFPGDSILTCIDIDGDKREINGIKIEQFSKDWVYSIITNKLQELDVKYMAVRSSSGGYHIYLYTLTESLRYESTKGLFYPKDLKEASKYDDIGMFLSANIKQFSSIMEDELPKSIVEIWCSKRYMVAPGSDIYDDDGQYIGTVELLSDGVQSFGDIGLLDQNLNDVVRDAFIENGFKEDNRQKYVSNYTVNFENNSYSSKLDDFSISIIGDLLIDVYPKISGQKHTATLALGGYLHNKGISLESAEKLGEYVVKNSPEGLFDNEEAFITTLTHDILTNDQSRDQTGLPTFEEIFSPFYTKEYIGKKMHLATNPTFHKFWPDGRFSKKFNEIIINHSQNYIIKNIINTKITNDGDIIDNKIQNFKIEHSVEGIYKIDDISNPEEAQEWEKPVQITFKTYQSPLKKSKIYKTSDAFFKEYRRLEGVYTDHAKSIIEDIYREYESLGFIQNVFSSTRPGIWFDSETRTLKKFVLEGGEIKEQKVEMPSKQKLRDSLSLLKKINEIYPWAPGKFGFFIKTCLTMPYADTLKYYFDKHHPSVILHGEAGTLKTTAAELIVNFNLDSLKHKDMNIISGGELFSEYRFGRAMDASSFPLVVNETEYLFSTPRIRELIKDSVTGKLIRKPGGNEPQGYYSHRASIYTMNTLPITTEDPAFLRRFIPIEFDGNERGDRPEIMEKLSFLNKDGIRNARFREFSVIGDFVFNTLNNNIGWLNMSIEKIQDNIVIALEQYSDMDLSFLKISGDEFVYIDRTDQENYKLTMILDILRKPFYYNKGKFLKDVNNVSIVRELLTNNSIYPYVNLIDDDYVLIDIGLKHKFNEEHSKDGTSITLKSCYYYLLDLDLGLTSLTYTSSRVQGRKKQVRGIRMSIEDFTRVLTNKSEI